MANKKLQEADKNATSFKMAVENSEKKAKTNPASIKATTGRKTELAARTKVTTKLEHIASANP